MTLSRRNFVGSMLPSWALMLGILQPVGHWADSRLALNREFGSPGAWALVAPPEGVWAGRAWLPLQWLVLVRGLRPATLLPGLSPQVGLGSSFPSRGMPAPSVLLCTPPEARSRRRPVRAPPDGPRARMPVLPGINPDNLLMCGVVSLFFCGIYGYCGDRGPASLGPRGPWGRLPKP